MRDTNEIINAMTVEEKVGQLFLLAYPGKDATIIKPLIDRFGVCGCYISQDNADTVAEARAANDTLQQMAQNTSHALPLLLGVDQEGAWAVLVPHSHTGPGNLALGAHHAPQTIQKMYNLFGKEMLSAQYNTVFAPCADVNANPDSPIIGTRSFGERFEHVAKSVSYAVRGVAESSAFSTLKHFPGHGATSGDTHREIPYVNKSLDELFDSDFVPFIAGIKAGADLVMTSHIMYPKIDTKYPATLSKVILHDVLRKRLGFEGVVISDSMNMGAIRKHFDPAESTLLALQAGVDIVMLSEEHYDHDQDYLGKQIASMERVCESIKSGELQMSTVDEKLRRIILLKQRIADQRIVASVYEEQQSVAIEQEAARGCIALLRDHYKLYPVPLTQGTLCVNATPRSAYSNIVNPRGIGPNQSEPAFDLFWRTIDSAKRGVRCLSHEQALTNADELARAERILLVSEDYPLPGEDMPKDEQQAFIRNCLAQYAEKCLLIGLRSPYELLDLPKQISYLCSYSSRSCSARETARLLISGEPPRGKNHLTLSR